MGVMLEEAVEKLQDVSACLKPVESHGAQLHLAEFLTKWKSELSSEEYMLLHHSGAVQLDNERYQYLRPPSRNFRFSVFGVSSLLGM